MADLISSAPEESRSCSSSTLIEALHNAGFEIGVRPMAHCSPRPGSIGFVSAPRPMRRLRKSQGMSLSLSSRKMNPKAQPERFETLDFRHFFLQPKDDAAQAENIAAAAQYCMKNSQWRLSLQTHKLIGLP